MLYTYIIAQCIVFVKYKCNISENIFLTVRTQPAAVFPLPLLPHPAHGAIISFGTVEGAGRVAPRIAGTGGFGGRLIKPVTEGDNLDYQLR